MKGIHVYTYMLLWSLPTIFQTSTNRSCFVYLLPNGYIKHCLLPIESQKDEGTRLISVFQNLFVTTSISLQPITAQQIGSHNSQKQMILSPKEQMSPRDLLMSLQHLEICFQLCSLTNISTKRQLKFQPMEEPSNFTWHQATSVHDKILNRCEEELRDDYGPRNLKERSSSAVDSTSVQLRVTSYWTLRKFHGRAHT